MDTTLIEKFMTNLARGTRHADVDDYGFHAF